MTIKRPVIINIYSYCDKRPFGLIVQSVRALHRRVCIQRLLIRTFPSLSSALRKSVRINGLIRLAKKIGDMTIKRPNNVLIKLKSLQFRTLNLMSTL